MFNKIIILIIVISLSSSDVFSQSCSIPQPLTKQQTDLINGEWKGYYILSGQRIAFSVEIKSTDAFTTCQISNPPLTGDILNEVYRFCGAGAFHFRKEIDDSYYEFDGVPENDTMKGTLTTAVNEKKVFGEFYLKKSN